MTNESNWYCQNGLHMNTLANNDDGLNHTHHHHHSIANNPNMNSINSNDSNLNGSNNNSNGNLDVNFNNLQENNCNSNNTSNNIGGTNFCLVRNSILTTDLVASSNQNGSIVTGNSTFTELQPAATVFTQLPSIETLSSGNKRN